MAKKAKKKAMARIKKAAKKKTAKKTPKKTPKKKTAKRGAQKGNKNREKWDPKFVGVALEVYSLGGGPKELAKACGASVGRVYEWFAEYPEFKAAAENGEKRFDDDCEAAYRKGLLMEATPHDEVAIDEEEVVVFLDDNLEPVARKDRDGSEMQVDGVKRKTVTKKGRFDVKNLANYLKRKRPEKYGDQLKVPQLETLADIAAALGCNDD